MAEPQPDKVRVASDGNCSETTVSSGDTVLQIFIFLLVARGIPDCLGRSPAPTEVQTALPRVTTLQDCETRLF